MLGPIPSLVVARLRRRAPTVAMSVGAVAAATALIAIVAGIGLIAADATVRRAFAATGPDRPVVRISHFSASDRDVDETTTAAQDTIAAHLGGLTTPVVRGLVTRELLDLEAPVFELVVAVDDPGAWLTLTEGRLPAPCQVGHPCEAVLLSEVAPSFGFDVARPAPGLELSVVGRGLIDAVPLGVLDQQGPFGERPGGADFQTGRESPAILLVDGVDAVARMPSLASSGRTYVWTAPIETSAVHPWTADALRSAIGGLTRDLAAIDSAYVIGSPVPLLDAALARADAARGRLLLIASLGVAILLAFAVFLALVVRDDVGAEVARLRSVGARRHERTAFLLLEALVPAGIGSLLGWAIGALVVAALAGWAGSEVGPVVTRALLAPGALAIALAVTALAVLSTAAAYAPGIPRGTVVPVAAAIALAVIGTLGWQLATSGALDAADLGGSVASPIVVLLPPALAFIAALLLAAILPAILRSVARRLDRAPLPARLSVLSLARAPGRPAATITLLAFSLGAIVFAAGWSASLRQGIHDAAAYRSGLDLRVTELGTGLSISGSVVPTARYDALGPDITTVPVLRETSPAQPGGAVEILGIPPEALPTLPGWRADFSDVPVDDLARHLAVAPPPGGWRVAGHPLPDGVERLEIPFRYDGDALRLEAIVATAGGDAGTVPLGVVRDGATRASARLPESAIGGTLVALRFENDALIAGNKHQGGVARATVAFSGLDGLVSDEPIDLEVFTVSTVTIAAPQATDGLTLPALVSPDLARDARPDGSLALHVGSERLPIRVVGIAERAPTVVEPSPRFVIVPLDPYLVALAGAVPGAGRPTEMWISARTPERLAEVRDALARPPFRFAQVTARAELVAERASDPLSQAIVWALLVAALAGVVLSVGGLVLGAATDLRDERGELADLEAQGIAPSSLRWHVLARTAWLAIGGALAGLAAGLLLTVVVTRALAIDAEGRLPIPPLAVVLPPAEIAAVIVGVPAAVLGLVAWLAQRAYRGRTLGQRRDAERRHRRPTTLSPGTERADG